MTDQPMSWELVTENEALRQELDSVRHYQEAAMDAYMKALGFGPDYDRKCSTVTLGISDLRAQLAASEARCKIFEDAFNDLQNAILDAQHILDKEG